MSKRRLVQLRSMLQKRQTTPIRRSIIGLCMSLCSISKFQNRVQNYERGTRARLSFSGEPHAAVNMVHTCSMEEGNVGGKKHRKWHIWCAKFHLPRFHKFLKFFRTSIASLDPETVQLPAFYTLFAVFTGACGPPEKLSLALVPCSNVLCTIVKLCYSL